jgi:hypothetical protein
MSSSLNCDEQRTDEADDWLGVREELHDIGAALEFAVQAFDGVVGPSLRPLWGTCRVGEQVILHRLRSRLARTATGSRRPRSCSPSRTRSRDPRIRTQPQRPIPLRRQHPAARGHDVVGVLIGLTLGADAFRHAPDRPRDAIATCGTYLLASSCSQAARSATALVGRTGLTRDSRPDDFGTRIL